jgi:glycosyltransferase involved in cell wall biosynthesis
MKLPVIIPFYNEEETILKIIDRVLGIKLDSAKQEIIVIDGGLHPDYEIVKQELSELINH